MTLTDEMMKRGEIFVENIYQDDFIQGVIAGDLDKEAVKHYLKADSIYLKKFADIYAILLSRTEEAATKQFFLEQIDFILNQEVLAHHFLAQYVGEAYHDIIADAAWYPSADHYIKHMCYQLQRGHMAYPLAAMSPCPWIYNRLAQEILKREEISAEHPFKPWIDFYTGELMDACLQVYFKVIDRFAQKVEEEEKEALLRIFLESCQHERNFFEMAVQGEDWPEEVRDV